MIRAGTAFVNTELTQDAQMRTHINAHTRSPRKRRALQRHPGVVHAPLVSMRTCIRIATHAQLGNAARLPDKQRRLRWWCLPRMPTRLVAGAWQRAATSMVMRGDGGNAQRRRRSSGRLPASLGRVTAHTSVALRGTDLSVHVM